MKKIYLITNNTKDKNYTFTKKIISFLNDCEKEVFVTEEEEKDLEGVHYIAFDELRDMDLAIVLGGDGTIIRASKLLADKGISIVGVNLGSLGFLADVEQDKYKDSLKEIFDGNFIKTKRNMLHVKVISKETDEVRFEAEGLNDVVVAREGVARMVGYSLYVNGRLIDSYSGDGILVSTTVGSTGYNLSAGGPILAPTSDTIVLTPISPHSFSARSIVLSSSDTVKIDLENNRKTWAAGVMLTVDGGANVGINKGEYIVVEKSDKSTTLISPKNHDFYKSLRYKLKTY